MSENDLIKWFLNKLNSCYEVKYETLPEIIYLVYDEKFARQKKLARILDKEIIYPTKVEGYCLFKIDYKYGWLWCDYDEIWSYFVNNYKPKYFDIEGFITNILRKQINFNKLTANGQFNLNKNLFLNKSKLEILVPASNPYKKINDIFL